MKHLILTIICLFVVNLCYSQNKGVRAIDETEEEITVDSSNVKPKRNGFFDIFKGKPGKAAFLSLLIPGGGQAYNRKYWKVPIAIGIDLTTLYYAREYSNLYKEYDAGFKQMVSNPDYQFLNFTSSSEVKLYRDAYRRRMEYAYVYFGIGHLITILDAFVDRHLMNFDINDDLSFNHSMEKVLLASGNTFSYPTLSLKFNLNKPAKKLEDYNLITP